MRWLLILCALCLAAPAQAESCSKSREYILGGLAGDLVEPAAGYRELFKTCMETLALPNVKDAFVLRDGGIATIAKQSSLSATAETLAQFCQRFPKNTLRFVTARELKGHPTVGSFVLLSSTDQTSCKKIRGLT